MNVPDRVLVLTNQLTPGGAEVYVLTVSRWLAEQGADVMVAATPGELVDRIAPSVTYVPVDLQDLRWSIPRAALRVRRLLRRHRPRVVLANSLVTALVARLAGLPAHVPVVSVAHGWPAGRYRLVSRPLAVADRVVPVSDDVAGRLLRAGLPAAKVTVVHNGVDLSPFGPRDADAIRAARAAFGAGPEDVVVASVGRYVEQKAQHRLVEMARRLAPTHPELKLGVIGWGPRHEALEALVRRHGLEANVRLLGRRRDVPDLLMAADLYVAASDWEGMPLSLIEAMAAGLPIVHTDVEGTRALIDDDNGVLVPAGDDDAALDALADAVGRFLDDEPLRLEKGSHSRLRAETRFSREVMCRNLAEVLVAVADGGPAR